MTPLAGNMGRGPRRESWLWLAAAALALAAHGGIALALLWRNAPPPPEAPAAAPLVMDVAFLAAPSSPPSELPPGPEQVEAQPEPEPVQEEPPPEPEIEPEVVLEEVPEPEPEPVERREEPDMDVAEPVDQSAPETSAPVGMDAPETDAVAAAPNLGVPSPQAVAAEQRWHSTVVAHLERRKRYPRQAQVMRREGVPMVKFTLDRDGKVLDVVLDQASGEGLLDREALALVRRAEPLPKPPPEVEGDSITLVVPIEFFITR